ncbi:beta-1,3-galactosyltransferase brn [Venturia canescens]|uniref:beta-1,3-galactosyltransferase brn n=1 Tax=Venturia canescens TaxID=32260 RepID=UPI001C9CF817|nr:beta-1,3-galactosyltransferase brn [Venturia canescens]XP_043273369.1 beta-1,3-galactosyltransferase brn [Venturia canescens]XP_043273370.1 beta-1,3-galactosyltransferase brn [Venturia canescens]XP_043273371.1 beta-1,3-galactosyltransferase brn [Venturia canescens]XP_043273372.1 beta-1,3-galactosyltransferase brn [Venturia canescens]XP_043273373.1 beta-1,3-galactosyltransferase brn [Venturia canescens]
MFCLLQPYLKKLLRCLRRIQLKYVCATVGVIMMLDVFGAFTHIFEVPYNDNFIYPYHGDIQPFIEALRHKKKPEVEPINEYNYTFIHNPKDKCVDPDFRTLQFVFLVKSATKNFDRRKGIRNSWGFGKRFFDVPTRLLFLLGTNGGDHNLVEKINEESEKFKDILQADFVDTYYNNTLKTMMGFKWAVEHCTNAKFYMFVDDDIYVSVKNVLRFVRNPASYPDYLKEPSRMAARKREIKHSDMVTDEIELEPHNSKNESFPPTKLAESSIETKSSDNSKTSRPSNKTEQITLSTTEKSTTNLRNLSADFPDVDKKLEYYTESLKNETPTINNIERKKRQVFDLELPEDVRLFAGYVFVSSPHRHRTSKWYVSLKEYPYHLWPPYITAGSYVLSKEALLDMYYASLYTQHFKFDDIFLGIVAKKADIEPFHCDEFHFYKKDYTKYNYKYVITSHGYDDPKELISVWQEQKSLGNA